MSAQAKAEQIDAAADDAALPKKKGSKKLILFIALPVVLLLGGGAGAYFMGLFGGAEEKPAAAAAAEAKDGKDAKAPTTVFYDLPEMLVNLNAKGRRSNFLKIQVSLEIPSDADRARLDAMRPRLVDSFQVYLRELRVEDLRGSAGMYRLREELLARVNTTVAPVKVKDVLFKDVLVQ